MRNDYCRLNNAAHIFGGFSVTGIKIRLSDRLSQHRGLRGSQDHGHGPDRAVSGRRRRQGEGQERICRTTGVFPFCQHLIAEILKIMYNGLLRQGRHVQWPFTARARGQARMRG